MKRRQKAFSLLELLISITIIGILVGIYVPSYRHYFIKKEQKEAQMAMLDLAEKLENYYLENGSYSGATKENLAAKSLENYDLQLTIQNDSYQISAIPKNKLVDDQICGTITFDSDGNQGNSSGNNSCWQ